MFVEGGFFLVRYRRRFPRKGPLPFRYVFVITFIIFMIFTFQGLWIINKGIQPTLMSMAESKIHQIATLAINEAVNKKISEYQNIEDLVVIEKSEDGRVSNIGWNMVIMRSFLSEMTKSVQSYLTDIEEGTIPPPILPSEQGIRTSDPSHKGVILAIPLGQATQNVLLANLGPVVPVRLSIVGDVNSDVVKKETEYGINNVIIELSVLVEVNIRVVIPFESTTVKVSTEIPIDIRSIQGEVPYFYNTGEGGEASIEAPLP